MNFDSLSAEPQFSVFADMAIVARSQIVEYIVHNGLMKDLSVLQEAPFADCVSIVEVFTDLLLWVGIRKAIERVIASATAIAA